MVAGEEAETIDIPAAAICGKLQLKEEACHIQVLDVTANFLSGRYRDVLFFVRY